MPAWLGVILSIGMMFLLAVTVERVVLRPLVNQPDIILFMATIGLNSFLIGFGEIDLRRRAQDHDHRGTGPADRLDRR